MPALEPQESPQQQTQMRRRVLAMNQDLGRRIARIEKVRMSVQDRKTLEDARAFLSQSAHALDGGDLPRAFNLARKTSLLVDALEKRK
jgi:hypothetical protein